MKKIIFFAASVLFCVFSLVLSSCSDDDDAKQSVAKPVVALAEIGKENSKEAIAGKDLHLEGNLVADGLIARIDVTIAAKDGNKTIVKQSYTEGKYIGVRNTTFHEHLDIPADAAPGAYTVTFVVTDRLGQSTTFTSDLTVKALDKTAPTITFKEVGEDDSHKAVIGQKMHLEAQIEAPHKIAKIEVEFHNTAAGYEHVFTYTDEKYVGETSALFHEHPQIPTDAPAGEYHIHFTVTDAAGNSTTEEAEGIQITKE